MNDKIKMNMENHLSNLEDYFEYLTNHLTNENLEEVEYYLDLMKNEIKSFEKDLINAFYEDE